MVYSAPLMLFSAVDGNIALRYLPDDLLREDRFNLVAAYDPMNNPTDVVTTLLIQPRIFIFNRMYLTDLIISVILAALLLRLFIS